MSNPKKNQTAIGENPPEEPTVAENPPEEVEEVAPSVAVNFIQKIAQMCHAVNAIYCESLGDFSQLPWSEAPSWQKNSARAGVRHALENPDATPEDSHKSWLKAKRADGWKYGEVKDVDLKTHPCMVVYEDLPIDQQRKDALFLAIVKSLS